VTVINYVFEIYAPLAGQFGSAEYRLCDLSFQRQAMNAQER